MLIKIGNLLKSRGMKPMNEVQNFYS